MSDEKQPVPVSPDAPAGVRLPTPGSLVLSSSPHVQNTESVPGIMLKVLICLIPVCAASIWYFGLNAVRVLVLCTAFSMIFEYLWNLLLRRPGTLRDYSAAVTGVILALNLPPAAPWWICFVGAFIAIIIAKAVFGGLGQNPFNPAAVARVALLIGFAGPMTMNWTATRPMLAAQSDGAVPVFSGATPLMQAGQATTQSAIDALQTSEKLWQMFIGNIGGSLGETSALAILIGGIALICCRLIRWQIPLAILGTVAVFTWIANLADPSLTPGPLFHLCSGGLMIGAFFMATDMVTSPVTRLGAFVFGVAIGLLVCVIRIWGGYPEGVSFAILIMNALVPLIDRFCYKRPFGWNSTSASALQMRRGEIK